jgi:hypothetical protein
VLSVAGGQAVVVGAAIVHADGSTSTCSTQPAWRSVCFVAIPGVYAALLAWFAERRLHENSWFSRLR